MTDYKEILWLDALKFSNRLLRLSETQSDPCSTPHSCSKSRGRKAEITSNEILRNKLFPKFKRGSAIPHVRLRASPQKNAEKRCHTQSALGGVLRAMPGCRLVASQRS